MKKTNPFFASMNHDPRPLSLIAGLLGAGFWVAQALPALAGPPDPFSTQGLVAVSPAGSIQRPVLPSPCKEAHSSSAQLSLADVVERALCNNPQTREAWANARFQAAQVGVGESAYLPSINLGGAESRNWSDGGGNAGRSYNQLSAALSLSYVLYDFGARDAALESAKQILATGSSRWARSASSRSWTTTWIASWTRPPLPIRPPP